MRNRILIIGFMIFGNAWGMKWLGGPDPDHPTKNGQLPITEQQLQQFRDESFNKGVWQSRNENAVALQQQKTYHFELLVDVAEMLIATAQESTNDEGIKRTIAADGQNLKRVFGILVNEPNKSRKERKIEVSQALVPIIGALQTSQSIPTQIPKIVPLVEDKKGMVKKSNWPKFCNGLQTNLNSVASYSKNANNWKACLSIIVLGYLFGDYFSFGKEGCIAIFLALANFQMALAHRPQHKNDTCDYCSRPNAKQFLCLYRFFHLGLTLIFGCWFLRHMKGYTTRF